MCLCQVGGQLFLELFSKSYVVELELSFQNPEFMILDCQNPEFEILDCQNPEFKILEFKILDFQNLEFRSLQSKILNSGFWQFKILNSGFWQSLTLTLSHNSTEITLLIVNLVKLHFKNMYLFVIYLFKSPFLISILNTFFKTDKCEQSVSLKNNEWMCTDCQIKRLNFSLNWKNWDHRY